MGQEIAVTALLLDSKNPRMEVQPGHRDAIRALFAEDPKFMLNLVEDVVKNGLSPLENIGVSPGQEGRFYIVREGNRRVAALCVFHSPWDHPRLCGGSIWLRSRARSRLKWASARIWGRLRPRLPKVLIRTVLNKGRSANLIGQILVLAAVLVCVPPASAFWLVNLGPAQTLEEGQFSIMAGTGGQYVSVGDPKTNSSFFFIPHAGVRYGLAKRLDVGYRLAPIPVPFTKQAPSIGGNLDAKFLFGDRQAPWKFAAIVGGGLGHVQVQNEDKLAYSPNAALLLTRSFLNGVDLTTMLRYVWIGIPKGPGGTGDNRVGIVGMSWGLKIPILERLSFLPEFGAYSYNGRLEGGDASGIGFQYALAFGATF